MQASLDALIRKGDSTVVLVAHRLSTVMNADKIAVIADGGVKEEGSHDELCAKGVSPVALWEGIPYEAKLQIILAIGIFEFYSEAAAAKGTGMGGHYMRGGKPGFFPPFKGDVSMKGGSVAGDAEGRPLLPHPVPLNLYDPFNLNAKKDDAWKSKRLQMEINNGRLAMIGLMSMLSEGAVPGSVPALKGLIPATGEINVMAPFDFSQPFVATLGVQGESVAAPRSGSVQMFSEGDIGVLPPLGVYDPLGLIETRDMRRYEIMEIKHGRAAMLGFLHIIAIHAGIRVPGYLSVSQDLKFSDVPAGCFASLEAVPTAGWLQIMVCRLGIQIKF